MPTYAPPSARTRRTSDANPRATVPRSCCVRRNTRRPMYGRPPCTADSAFGAHSIAFLRVALWDRQRPSKKNFPVRPARRKALHPSRLGSRRPNASKTSSPGLGCAAQPASHPGACSVKAPRGEETSLPRPSLAPMTSLTAAIWFAIRDASRPGCPPRGCRPSTRPDCR